MSNHRTWLAALLLAWAAPAMAAGFSQCIIKSMPGIANAAAHAAAWQQCSREYPDRYWHESQGDGLGLFGPRNASQCVLKHAKKTAFPASASAIRTACTCLYEPAQFDTQSCREYQLGLVRTN